MNNPKVTGLLVAFAIASCVGLLAAQDAASPRFTQTLRSTVNSNTKLPPPPMPIEGQNGLFARGWRNTTGLAVNSAFEPTEVQKAMEAIKTAESSEDKSEAKAKLKEALGVEYEDRMDSYDKHIESLEKELGEMRKRLRKRREAKSEMVDLKMRQLLAEIDGLGWPGGSTRSVFPTSNFRRSNLATPARVQVTRPLSGTATKWEER